MECPVCKHRWSPSRARNDSDTKIGRSSWSDAVIDSATNTATTAQPSPVNDDNSQPSSGPRISSAAGAHYKSVKTLSAALEASQSRANERQRDSEYASKIHGYQPRRQTQVDHHPVENDDAEEAEYYEDSMKTYDSQEEEDCYEYLDDHPDENPEDDYEDLQEEEEDDDGWEEHVD